MISLDFVIQVVCKAASCMEMSLNYSLLESVLMILRTLTAFKNDSNNRKKNTVKTMCGIF